MPHSQAGLVAAPPVHAAVRFDHDSQMRLAISSSLPVSPTSRPSLSLAHEGPERLLLFSGPGPSNASPSCPAHRILSAEEAAPLMATVYGGQGQISGRSSQYSLPVTCGFIMT